MNYKEVEVYLDTISTNAINSNTKKLLEISQKCKGQSGRMIRKLSFLTYSQMINDDQEMNYLNDYLDNMMIYVQSDLSNGLLIDF